MSPRTVRAAASRRFALLSAPAEELALGWYARHVLPRLVDACCGVGQITKLRRRVVPSASGRVLELGFGSGLNLPWYDPERVTSLIGVEPSAEMRRLARERLAEAPFPVELADCEAERLELERDSVDSAVVTFSLCTIAEPEAALAGVRRALRPGGRLYFCEHGLAPEPGVARWQRRMTPVWRRAFGGCRLDRDVLALLAACGFHVSELETGYVPRSIRIAGFAYRGAAAPR